MLVKKSLFCFILETNIANIKTTFMSLSKILLLNVLHIDTSANTAKMVAGQSKIFNLTKYTDINPSAKV